MATYESVQLTANGGAAASRAGVSHGLGGDLKAFFFQITSTAATVTTDTINVGYVPAGFRCLGVSLSATDMDGGAGLAFHIGDADDPDRLVASSAVGQANTLTTAMRAVALSSGVISLGLGYKYTSRTLITMTISADAASAGVAGTFVVVLFGTIEGVAS